MKIRGAIIFFLIVIHLISAVSAHSIHGCGGFVKVNPCPNMVFKKTQETLLRFVKYVQP